MCLLLLAPVCSAQGPRMYCGEDNCYHILGVDNDASAASVRKAYRDLAKQYHPDKNKGPGQADAAAMFVKVAEAYEILSDDELRSSYDYYLAHPEERMRNQCVVVHCESPRRSQLRSDEGRKWRGAGRGLTLAVLCSCCSSIIGIVISRHATRFQCGLS